ncbi:hypothetical protein ACVU7I_19225, partial [Patulibacter sp. S7RM1-6]
AGAGPAGDAARAAVTDGPDDVPARATPADDEAARLDVPVVGEAASPEAPFDDREALEPEDEPSEAAPERLLAEEDGDLADARALAADVLEPEVPVYALPPRVRPVDPTGEIVARRLGPRRRPDLWLDVTWDEPQLRDPRDDDDSTGPWPVPEAG